MKKFKTFYRNFLEKCERATLNLEQNKIAINESDSYADKTFFAFLADLLKGNTNMKLQNILRRELEENEELTKEKLQLVLKDQLKEYMKLDKEILEQKGLAKLDYEQTNKLLDNENFMEFAHELISNKLEKFKNFIDTLKEKGKDIEQIDKTLAKQDFSIKVKDIQSLNAKANSVVKNKQEAVNIVKTLVLKKT